MADALVNNFKVIIMNGGLDLDTDTIHVALITSSWTPNIDTDVYFSTPEAYEVSGTGYTAGGQALAGKAVTVDNTDNEGVFDANDVVWTTSTITARYAVLYKKLGGASSADPIIGYIDFGTDKISTAGSFTITWNAEGIINLN